MHCADGSSCDVAHSDMTTHTEQSYSGIQTDGQQKWNVFELHEARNMTNCIQKCSSHSPEPCGLSVARSNRLTLFTDTIDVLLLQTKETLKRSQMQSFSGGASSGHFPFLFLHVQLIVDCLQAVTNFVNLLPNGILSRPSSWNTYK
jgi:hypothetical protein